MVVICCKKKNYLRNGFSHLSALVGDGLRVNLSVMRCVIKCRVSRQEGKEGGEKMDKEEEEERDN